MSKIFYFFIFALWPTIICGTTWQPESLMPLTNDYPILIDSANKKENLKSEEDAYAKYQAKTFPWNGVIAILAIALAYIIAKNRDIVVPMQKEDPREKAKYARAKALQKIGLLSSGQLSVKNYFSQLSYVLRQFIEERYEIKAQTATTEEFLKKIQAHPIFDERMKILLTRFMNSADLAKYAQHSFTRQQEESAVRTVQEFVEL